MFPYYNTVDQLYHSQWVASKLSRLALLQKWIDELWQGGHPTRLIHVAGTSGKGSTTRFLEKGLSLVGKSGALMSPHLFDVRERFSIDGQVIAPEKLTAIWEKQIRPLLIRQYLENPKHTPSFPEITILTALALFAEEGVAWGVIETGIGGRYDQSRALSVMASVLTNVGNDHEHMLGSELWQRVVDKAGIARAGVPFFTSEQNPLACQIIGEICAHEGAELTFVQDETLADMRRLLGHTPLPAQALLQGDHQLHNAALAATTLQALFPAIQRAELVEIWRTLQLTGRFSTPAADIVVDVAHNPDKMQAFLAQLSPYLQTHFRATKHIFVVGISGGRSALRILRPLLPYAAHLVLSSAAYKGVSLAELQAELTPLAGEVALAGEVPLHWVEQPHTALDTARQLQQPGQAIVLTGSTYLIEQVLNPDPYLRHLNATFGWRTELVR
jgi:dihydrofolate synthase/folylpolyglutamate synthase